MINVTVSLQTKLEKSPFYYAVLHWVDPIKKDQYRWKTTKVKYIDESQKRLHRQSEQEANNKAEEIRKAFEDDLNKHQMTNLTKDKSHLLFTEYLKDWLKSIENTKAKTTIGGYQSNINSIIIPYFEEKQILLNEITNLDLQDFYDLQYQLGKDPRTVKHYHYNIRQALEKAKKMKLIETNPADECCLEKPRQFIPQIYNSSELKIFLEKIKDIEIEIPVMLVAYYGLRREEALGLKWNRIDFENDTITIAHVVTTTTINHKHIINKVDIAKNNSSYRTLPLIPVVKDFLLKVKRKQDKSKKLFGNAYKNYDNYVCVNDEGELIKPNTLTRKFSKFLKDNNLRKIRLHDLRHSVGSLLIKEISTREVQEFLGHSNVSTTELYTHLDCSSKQVAANVISNVLKMVS